LIDEPTLTKLKHSVGATDISVHENCLGKSRAYLVHEERKKEKVDNPLSNHDALKQAEHAPK